MDFLQYGEALTQDPSPKRLSRPRFLSSGFPKHLRSTSFGPFALGSHEPFFFWRNTSLLFGVITVTDPRIQPSVYCSVALSYSPSGTCSCHHVTITWFRSDQNWMPQQTNWRACNSKALESSSARLPAIWAVALACRSTRTRSNTSLYHHQTDSDYSFFAPRFDSCPEIANQSCNCKLRAFRRQSNQTKPFGHAT